MTDTNKYKNVSLSKEAHEQLKQQSGKLTDAKLSISKTVEVASNILQGILEDPEWVKTVVGSPAYNTHKEQLIKEKAFRECNNAIRDN